MALDVWQYGDVRCSGNTFGKLWLSGHALLLGLIAWFPVCAGSTATRSIREMFARHLIAAVACRRYPCWRNRAALVSLTHSR